MAMPMKTMSLMQPLGNRAGVDVTSNIPVTYPVVPMTSHTIVMIPAPPSESLDLLKARIQVLESAPAPGQGESITPGKAQALDIVLAIKTGVMEAVCPQTESSERPLSLALAVVGNFHGTNQDTVICGRKIREKNGYSLFQVKGMVYPTDLLKYHIAIVQEAEETDNDIVILSEEPLERVLPVQPGLVPCFGLEYMHPNTTVFSRKDRKVDDSVIYFMAPDEPDCARTFVAGSHPPLGSWDMGQALEMAEFPKNSGMRWCTTFLEQKEHFEFKLFRRWNDGGVQWEPVPYINKPVDLSKLDGGNKGTGILIQTSFGGDYSATATTLLPEKIIRLAGYGLASDRVHRKKSEIKVSATTEGGDTVSTVMIRGSEPLVHVAHIRVPWDQTVSYSVTEVERVSGLPVGKLRHGSEGTVNKEDAIGRIALSFVPVSIEDNNDPAFYGLLNTGNLADTSMPVEKVHSEPTLPTYDFLAKGVKPFQRKMQFNDAPTPVRGWLKKKFLKLKRSLSKHKQAA